MTPRLRLVTKDGRPFGDWLTHEEGRNLTHCMVAWKATKRQIEKQAELDRAEKRRRRIQYGLAVFLLLIAFAFTLAGTYWAAGIGTASFVAWTGYLKYEAGPEE